MSAILTHVPVSPFLASSEAATMRNLRSLILALQKSIVRCNDGTHACNRHLRSSFRPAQPPTSHSPLPPPPSRVKPQAASATVGHKSSHFLEVYINGNVLHLAFTQQKYFTFCHAIKGTRRSPSILLKREKTCHTNESQRANP